jgi:hypothetical protein
MVQAKKDGRDTYITDMIFGDPSIAALAKPLAPFHQVRFRFGSPAESNT